MTRLEVHLNACPEEISMLRLFIAASSPELVTSPTEPVLDTLRKAYAEQTPIFIVAVAPTEADWNTLLACFDLHPLSVEDARSKHKRSKLDHYKDHLYISIPAVAGTESRPDDTTTPISVFVGHHLTLVVCEQNTSAVDGVISRFTQEGRLITASENILYHLIDTVVDEYFPMLDLLDNAIDDLEVLALTPGSSVVIADTVKVKRLLITLRQTVSPIRDVVNRLLRINDTGLVPADHMMYYQDAYDHTLRIVEQIDLHRDLLGGVVDVILSQTSNQLNTQMKTMTAISTVLMVCALIASVYGMNFTDMPELKWPFGYVYCLGLMLFCSVALVLYFKRLRWF